MSSNYKGKNYDPNYHSRTRGNNSNNHGYNNNNNNNSSNTGNNNYSQQGAKRKRPSKGPPPGQGRGKRNHPGNNNTSNRNNHSQSNNYDDGGSDNNHRIVLSPSSSFGEQSDIAQSDSESETSVQGQGKQNIGQGVNGSNYRGPPEKYDPNYHKNKWKRARSSSGDPNERGKSSSINGGSENSSYGAYQSKTYQPTNSAPASSIVPTFAPVSNPYTAGTEQEALLARKFGLVIPPIPRNTPQSHGDQKVDAAKNDRIKADTLEQLKLEIRQLEKERTLAVQQNRADNRDRASFEIAWRGAEVGYYRLAFHRADTITHPAEKYKYLLELQMNQNGARRRMEDRMKRETPSALRAIMGESLTATHQIAVLGSTSSSTLALPQRAFVPAQGQLNSIENQVKQNTAFFDVGKIFQHSPHASPSSVPASNPLPSSLPRAGLAGNDVKVKVEPSESTVSIRAITKPSSTPSPAPRSSTTSFVPSSPAPTVSTAVATTTFQPSPSPVFTPFSTYPTGVSTVPAIKFSTFTPTVPLSPFNFSASSNSIPFAFGQTSSPGPTATSTSAPPFNAAATVASASVQASTAPAAIASTPKVADRATASLASVAPSLPHVRNSTIALELPGGSLKAESEPTQGTNKSSVTTTAVAPVPTASELASASPALTPTSVAVTSVVPASVALALVAQSPHKNIASVEAQNGPATLSSPITDALGRRGSAVDNLASLVLASANSLLPPDLDKQMAKLQEDNKEQAIKYEKLQRIVESEARRREAIEKQVAEYQIDLQSSRITALEKDLECRRAEAVEMMAKAREERLQAREETAKARQGQAEAREEVTKARLGQTEATLRAVTAEAENQRLRIWIKENESRLGGMPPSASGAAASLAMTAGPSVTSSSPLSASLSRFLQTTPLNAQPLATINRLALGMAVAESTSDVIHMDLGSEAESPAETKPVFNSAAPDQE
ncbi:MAG: hypothetical protein BYD32DRAFT_408323 [Podila humilis]|nr:MAG: hypothetical protein BYD32DRAFT_408323 [Podila humilis]